MKLVKSVALVAALFFLVQAPVLAQEPVTAAGPVTTLIPTLNGIGIGLTIIGAALGIGRLTAAAVEGMARQPEIAAGIQTAMIISAALIEGVAFFALIVLGFILK